MGENSTPESHSAFSVLYVRRQKDEQETVKESNKKPRTNQNHLLAIMSTVTNTRTLSTTTQGSRQSTSSALKDILINMLGTSPREGAGIVATEHVQW